MTIFAGTDLPEGGSDGDLEEGSDGDFAWGGGLATVGASRRAFPATVVVFFGLFADFLRFLCLPSTRPSSSCSPIGPVFSFMAVG